MISFLARYYYLTALGCILMFSIPLLLGFPFQETVPQALVWSGPIASIVLYFEFRRQNYWVLFDNLRISRRLYLALFSLSVSLTGIILIVAL